ncbi:hypothetical protein DRJ22_05315, partial [Candidatus Woesearchaeota archaeon]
MHSNNKIKTEGRILLMLAVIFGLFASYHIILDDIHTNTITGHTIIEQNNTQNTTTQEIQLNTTIQNNTQNTTTQEIQPNTTIQNNTQNTTIQEIQPNTTIQNNTETNKEQNNLPKKRHISELQTILSTAKDHYCEDISSFLKRCIIQTEKELCHLEGKEIVCTGMLNTESYTNSLTTEQKQTMTQKGIPIQITGKNKTYFNPTTGTRLKVDWNTEKYIHIGFHSDNFYIQNFYYGTNEGNISIDVGVELKPTDSKINLPQASHLVGRWDFITNADDTSGLGNNGTVYGATHTYERYNFDGVDDYIDAGNDDSLNASNNMTVSAWIYSNENQEDNAGIVGKGDNTAAFWFLGINANKLFFRVNDGTDNQAATPATLTIPNKKWTHVVGVINGKGATNLKIYQNGVEVGTADSSNIDSLDNIKTLKIGRQDRHGTKFNGSIENVIIWNTSLTASEIQQIYNQTRFNTAGNTQTYSGLFTGGVVDSGQTISRWSSLNWTSTEPTGTSIELRYRTGNYSKTDLTNSNLVSYWNMNRSDATNIMDDSGVDDSLLLHFKFNNENDLSDYSGYGNDGTNHGSSYTQKGYIKGARFFDGSNDYIDYGTNIPELRFQRKDNFSVSFWIKPSNDNPNYAGIIQHQNPSNFAGWYAGIYSTSGIIFVLATTGTDKDSVAVGGGTLKLNEWNHVVVTLNGTNATGQRIFINGQEKNAAIYDNDCGTNIDYSSSTGEIGKRALGSIEYKGLIDNIRVYNKTLTPTQIK